MRTVKIIFFFKLLLTVFFSKAQPPAVPAVETAGIIAAAPAMPASSDEFYSEGFRESVRAYKAYLDTQELLIETSQNQIQAADAKARYTAAGDSAEVTAVKKIFSFQQSQQVFRNQLSDIQQREQKVKAQKDAADSAVAKEQETYLKANEKQQGQYATFIDLKQFDDKRAAAQTALISALSGIYRQYKQWYITYVINADAFLKQLAYGARIKNLNTRNQLRNIQVSFYGAAVNLLDKLQPY